jgi:hypothetical protein
LLTIQQHLYLLLLNVKAIELFSIAHNEFGEYVCSVGIYLSVAVKIMLEFKFEMQRNSTINCHCPFTLLLSVAAIFVLILLMEFNIDPCCTI